MRKVLFASVVLIAMFFQGCETIDRLTQFHIDYSTSVIVPASTGVNLPFNLMTPKIESNAESTMAVNDTRKDMVEEVSLSSLKLTLTSPSNEDFSFLESITIYINADGMAETKVAWKENVSATAGSVIELDVTGVDLKDYILKDEFTLRVNVVTDEFLATEHQIKVDARFFIDAKILGQ